MITAGVYLALTVLNELIFPGEPQNLVFRLMVDMQRFARVVGLAGVPGLAVDRPLWSFTNRSFTDSFLVAMAVTHLAAGAVCLPLGYTVARHRPWARLTQARWLGDGRAQRPRKCLYETDRQGLRRHNPVVGIMTYLTAGGTLAGSVLNCLEPSVWVAAAAGAAAPRAGRRYPAGRSSASTSARRRARLRELAQKPLRSFRQRFQPFELDL